MTETIKYCEVVEGECSRFFYKLQCSSCKHAKGELKDVARQSGADVIFLKSGSRDTLSATITTKQYEYNVSICKGKRKRYSKGFGLLKLRP